MNNDMIAFVAAATSAGFARICNLTANNGGFAADAVMSGEPCRVSTAATVDGIRWYVPVDSIGQASGACNDADIAADEANSLIAIHSPESRVAFSFDAIREIVTRHVDYSSATEEQAKAADDALDAEETETAERALLYVALTRARRTCYVSASGTLTSFLGGDGRKRSAGTTLPGPETRTSPAASPFG